MSKYGKTVFIEGSWILGKILKTMYDTAIKTFNMLLNNDSISAECNFCSHLIYFQFLKLKRYDVISNSITSICMEWFVHLTFKHLKFVKFKTKYLHGNGSINSSKKALLNNLTLPSPGSWTRHKVSQNILTLWMVAMIRCKFIWCKVNRGFLPVILQKLLLQNLIRHRCLDHLKKVSYLFPLRCYANSSKGDMVS